MQLPIYHHPSLTVLVDDSDSFLRSLSFQLDPSLASKSFHDTRAALDWLAAHASGGEAALSATYDTYPDAQQRCSVAFDVDQIARIRLRRERFLTPSVLVVDYSMPQMNGVELCEAIRHLPCKKILFTGAADEKVAVDAFNRGLIDRYIRKSDDDALDRLEQEILALQNAYFAARSEPLRDLLALHQYSFVADPAFGRLVREIVAREGIVEHYLYANPPGILMHDRQGRAQLMVVETEAGMDAHYEMAVDNDGPDALLDALRERCIIPYFPQADGMYSQAFSRGWHRYTQAAQVCQGRETYYWALFPLEGSELEGPAHSFEAFLNEREPA
ncbi:MAG: response regulator [Gammaproteobacteria bacterium]